MQIRAGYDITFTTPQRTPMIVMLHIHPSRFADLVGPETINSDPATPISYYRDRFGNQCGRLVAPAGRLRLSCRAIVRDHGRPDAVVPTAEQIAVEKLPDECLVYLMGSRYC